MESVNRAREPSPLPGAPFFLRELGTRHDGVTLLLLDVAPATPRLRGVLDTLSIEERERAARFASAEDRLRFALTRAALRHSLGAATGRAPESLVFGAGPFGKPCLADADGLFFNVSHSGSLALIGLSRRRPIGVDIERMRDLPDLLDLAEACFSARDYRALAGLPPRARESAFYAIWTGKEAILKALGTGIADGLRDFSVCPIGRGFTIVPETDSFARRLAGAALERVEVPATYAAAFALA